MSGELRLRIVTPEGEIYNKPVEMVTLPTAAGEIGILSGHAPLFTLMAEGEIVAKRGEATDRILITGGCAEVKGDSVSILTVFATDEERVDEMKAEEARRRAEERLQEREKLSPEELALVQAALSHSLAQLRIHRRRRRPGQSTPPSGGRV